MNREFWLSQLGALLIGMLLLFLAPYVQRWRDKRAIKRGQKKSEKVREHYVQVLVFALDPHAFTQYLTWQVTRAFLPAVMMIVGILQQQIVAVPIGVPSSSFSYIQIYWVVSGVALWIFGAYFLTDVTRSVGQLWFHVHAFDEYVASVPGEFRKPVAERVAREKLGLPATEPVTPSPPATS